MAGAEKGVAREEVLAVPWEVVAVVVLDSMVEWVAPAEQAEEYVSAGNLLMEADEPPSIGNDLCSRTAFTSCSGQRINKKPPRLMA